MLGLKDIFDKIAPRRLDKKNADGETRLYRAVREGNLGEVRKLLQKGADIDLPNDHGMTPLHLAAYWGEARIVELLLRAGADPNSDTGKGWTPLHSAALAGGKRTRKNIIDMLKQAGAKDDIRDKNGWTAAEYMALWENDAVAAEKLKTILYVQNGIDSRPLCDSTGQPCQQGCHKLGPRSPKH